MRAVFLGTPAFAVPSLIKLREICDVVAVICQPDRAKDRKGRVVFSPVKQYAIENNIPVYQFAKIKAEGVEILKELAPDVMITCAYGQILSQEILDIPSYGVINVHGSLLPKYRGSSPLQWCLINGEKVTGVTIMKTDIGMDTGDMLRKREIIIKDDTYLDDLFSEAATVGAELLAETLPDYLDGKIVPEKQDDGAATGCVMLKKEDALIDWSLPSEVIRNRIRGMGYGYTFYNGEQLKIYKLDLAESNGVAPGEVEIGKNLIKVSCGNGAVIITDLQLQNRKRMVARDFLNGVKIVSGERFGN